MRAEVTQDGEVDLSAAEGVHRAVRPGPAADRRAPRVLQIRLDGHVHPRDGQLRLGCVLVDDLRRRMNIELNFPPNFEGLVLGCIDADVCE